MSGTASERAGPLSGDGEWRTAYLRQVVELAAVRANVRRPALFPRLIPLDQLTGDTPEALRLSAQVAVAEVLEGAPELRAGAGPRGLLSAGGRGTWREPKPDSDAWLRAAARRR
jgi:hypothetical protein